MTNAVKPLSLRACKDEDRDDQTNLNVWILDGNPIHSHLLKFAINEESFGDCYIMICVSMARPWDIVDNLKKWASILEEHIRRLSIPEENICEYKTSVFHHFCNYLEPDVTPSLSTVHQSDALPVDMHRKLYKMHPASAFLLSNTLDSSTPPAKDVEPVNITVKSSRDGNTLCNNLGVPLVVVVTKTDTMSTLEKEHQLTEEHFDFIQMHVRRFCLSCKYSSILLLVGNYLS
ncbi:unnamed protein product [Heterobilharzia americana]|nr:unnamed protein product [Heterobilharzia americana]